MTAHSGRSVRVDAVFGPAARRTVGEPTEAAHDLPHQIATDTDRGSTDTDRGVADPDRGAVETASARPGTTEEWNALNRHHGKCRP